MTALKTLLASAALVASVASANAATYFADTVEEANYGICTGTVRACTADDRQNLANAVDGNASTFYALGLGGSLLVSFSQIMGNIMPGTVSVFEITFNRLVGHDEAADVFAVDADGNESLLGRITNAVGGNSVLAGSPFRQLRLVDVTREQFPDTTSFDGYDVAQISVAPVPLPAAGLMLLGGLGGLAALRRRKKAV
ncbi:VPLPA-CTERM sorting domain-containing protein [Paracoccus aestuarii]|uniref:VPLPA-CTERM sorting domain-containing protein n=1 Tax=Paracoccus aestuarii TaxID=453842 RepID=A0A418ZPJ8_9RHOB|nr:VPLPA-CTERM sorting domain-containing protein [Paracoccus aestuarii]